MSGVQSEAFEEFYKDLGTKSGEHKIYKLAKIKKGIDLDQVRCIKDEEGKVFGQRSRYRREMAQIFYKLFNYGQGSACNMEGLEIQENEQNLAYCHRIQIEKVKEALKRMDNGKAIGSDGIPIEVWKCIGEQGII